MITLIALAATQLTAYVAGGKTRLQDGSIPHMSMCKPVAAGDPRWRAHVAAQQALDLLNQDLVANGGEPTRLTDATRDQDRQAADRAGYDMWVDAGKPEPNKGSWRPGMRTAYAAKPGESNHGWGGAFDIDVHALVPGASFLNARRGSDDALAEFWEMAGARGFTPIIAHPSVDQSESWHFDHFGPLAAVKALYAANGYKGSAYSQAARVGCVLAGTMPRASTIVKDKSVAYVQARLALAGIFPGSIDGDPGKLYRAGLAAAGLPSGLGVKPESLFTKIDEMGLGLEALNALNGIAA